MLVSGRRSSLERAGQHFPENAHVWGGTGRGFHAVVTLGACHVQRPGSALGLSDFPGGGWGHSGLRDVSSRLGAVRGWASLPAWPSRAAELKESLAAMTTASSLSLGSEHPKAGRLCAQSSPSSGAPSTYGHQNPSRPLTALEHKTQLV